MVDTLSDVLGAIRLKGAIYFTVDASSHWVAEAPAAREIAAVILPGTQHLMEYHVVTSGSCWGGIAGEEPVRLSAGDVIVFPQGDPHVLSSVPGLRSSPQMKVYEQALGPELFTLSVGEGGPQKTGLLCGFLGCDVRPFNALLETLPRMLHVRQSPGRRDGPLSQLIGLAISEAEKKRMGGQCMLTRISELMFIEVVRLHLEEMGPDQRGWLAGLRDQQVGRALSLLHTKTAHSWTLEELAQEAGLSRSTFAERFNQLVGRPPMQYLAQWRMQIAAAHLSRGDSTVADVAMKVGYESEAAFSRTFKRLVGIPPGSWRRSQGYNCNSITAGDGVIRH
jgi:AraC-like DNA-binding protein